MLHHTNVYRRQAQDHQQHQQEMDEAQHDSVVRPHNADQEEAGKTWKALACRASVWFVIFVLRMMWLCLAALFRLLLGILSFAFAKFTSGEQG